MNLLVYLAGVCREKHHKQALRSGGAAKNRKNMGSGRVSQHFRFTLFPGFRMMKTTREQEMRLETQ